MLKQLIVVTFSWKTTIIYSKVLYLILNVQVSIQNFYFKLLNMCKFAHDRKTQNKNMSRLQHKSKIFDQFIATLYALSNLMLH